MSDLRRFVVHGARYVTSAAVTAAFWLLWIVLGLLASAQIYIACRNELQVPDFVLRRLEARFADAGITVTFDRATFDPTGRILVQSPRVFLPQYTDPVVTARGAYVGLNPWMIVIGRFEPREMRILEGNVLVPAVLSPSGRSQPIVRDLDGFIVPGDREIRFRHVTGRVGALLISVHGAIGYTRQPGRTADQTAQLVRLRFAEFCRGAVDFTRRLDAFEEPSIDLQLDPSTTRGAIVSVDLMARGLKLDSPIATELTRLRATTHFPLFGDAPSTSRLDLRADEVRLPGEIELRRVFAVFRGRLRPSELRVHPIEVDVEAGSVRAPEGTAESISVIARPDGLPRWQSNVVGRVLGSEVGVNGTVDFGSRSATLTFSGGISPHVLDVVSMHTKVDVRKYFDFDALECRTATARFGAGWKFESLDARVALRGINAYGVNMDDGYAWVQLDPHRLYSPDAYARVGENFAQGTYEHDFASGEFRFLLDGRLRPMEIEPWFHTWWSDFFDRFKFPAKPPAASVDVHGYWRGGGRKTTVFVFADAAKPVIHDQALARVRTRIFIRPGFYDDLELYAVDPAGGEAIGTFTVRTNLDSDRWHSIDVDARSTIAFGIAEGIAGELGKPYLSPFQVARSPAVTFQGHFDGPDLDVRHDSLDLAARSPGAFGFYGLPFEDVNFTAALRDDELTVDVNEAKFASGSLKAHAKVWGPERDRRIGFDVNLNDSKFAEGLVALQKFAASRKGVMPPPSGKFIQEKANVRIDISISADGLFGNTQSFKGGGNAVLRGPEIGEVPLFGPLSDLLKFTALRFTTARSSFKINGPKIEFPDVALRGANSAIDAHGEYLLDRRQLDFRAKVFPFQESGSVIKSVVGAVLTPISNVLEVKLTGTLEKPDWAFVIGPTNLFRSLSPNEPETASTEAAGKEHPEPASPKTTPPPAPGPKSDGPANAPGPAPKVD